jgi:SPP1 gp7 family putative phage head morphogenesis protein
MGLSYWFEEAKKLEKRNKNTVNYRLASQLLSSRADLILTENKTVKELLSVLDPVILDIQSNLVPSLTRVSEGVVKEAEEPKKLAFSSASALAKRVIDIIGYNLNASSSQISLILKIVLSTLFIREVQKTKEILDAGLKDVKPYVNVDFSASLAQIRAAVEQPLGGKAEQLLKARYGDTLTRIRAVLVQGLIGGWGVPKITKSIVGVVNTNLRPYIGTLARTEIHRIASTVNKTMFRQNSDIIKMTQWLATLDLRVCIRCGNLDGKTFPLGDDLTPPIHPRCRCVEIPVVKSMSELGGDDIEMPPEVRASMDGTVPGSISFPEWFGDLSSDKQKKYLGPARYQLYQSGALKFSDFSSVDRIFSLGEL